MRKINPTLLYWLLITICVLIMGIFGGCSKVSADEGFQYEQTKVRRTVVGRLGISKTVSIALSKSNNDILYIMVRHIKSKVWFPVANLGIPYKDRTEPYCVVHWNGVNTTIRFYNLHVGDYYKISVMR